MSDDEKYLTEAVRKSLMFGGSIVDRYREEVDAHPGRHGYKGASDYLGDLEERTEMTY